MSPLHTAEGLFVICTIRDTSERKLAETKLRKAEARYRTLLETIPAVTFMASLDGGANEMYVSPQIETMLGFSQSEWLGDPVLWYRQLHPDDRERWHKEFARTCAVGEQFRSEYRFISRSGSVVWVHGEATLVRDDDGTPLFLQGIAFDITERKAAEQMMLQSQSDLERRVQDRTADLGAAESRAAKMKSSSGARPRSSGRVMSRSSKKRRPASRSNRGPSMPRASGPKSPTKPRAPSWPI